MPLPCNIPGPLINDSITSVNPLSSLSRDENYLYSLRDSIDHSLLLRGAPDAESIFGGGSYVNPELLLQSDGGEMGGFPFPWQYTAYLLVVLFLYLIVIYRYRTSIRDVFKSAFTMNKTLGAFEMQSNDMGSFLRFGTALTMLSLTSLLTDIAIRFGIVAPDKIYLILAAAIIMLLATAIYRAFIIGMARLMDSSGEFYQRLRFINRMSMTVAAVILTPIITITGLGDYPPYTALAVLSALLCYHIGRLFKYFILSEFSILQWFLYLCTVEILPISFVIALATRGSIG